MNLIDTAEMYADGEAEILVGEAIAGAATRSSWSASYCRIMRPAKAQRACEDSLRHLKTDRLDLNLLHWPGPMPLAATVEAFLGLQTAGLIRNWRVSNFDVSHMEELISLPGGPDVATDQLLYTLTRRGPEYDLFPACRELGIPVMAYSPVEQGRILSNPVLRDIAIRRDATPVQIALAWFLRLDGVCAIPRSSKPEHVYENRAARRSGWTAMSSLRWTASSRRRCTPSRWRCSSTGRPAPYRPRGLRHAARCATVSGGSALPWTAPGGPYPLTSWIPHST
jgi:diketogulonate reductase-like aldo/keto reductase